MCAEPSRELWAGKCLHQKAPFTLAFSNVTFAWGFLPASPFCALTSRLIPASGRASGSLGVELFVRYARESVSCGIKGDREHKCCCHQAGEDCPQPSLDDCDTHRDEHHRDAPVHCGVFAGSPASPAAACGRGHRHCPPLGLDGNPVDTGGEVGNESQD